MVKCRMEPYDMYIGRPGKWGNKFTHKPGTKAEVICESRDEAVKAYKNWILFGDGRHLLKDLHHLKGKTLGCWCKPQACHGDILAELADKI